MKRLINHPRTSGLGVGAGTQKMSRLQQEVQDLEKQGNQKLAVIDRFAPRVVEEISRAAREKKFKISLLGPVGDMSSSLKVLTWTRT